VFFIFLMALFSHFSVVQIPLFKMVYELMFPLIFLACFSFLFSTLVKNGNGAAVIVVIFGLIFWFLGVSIEGSKWNLFLNPFIIPENMNITIWQSVISQNRLILIISAIVSILWALMNLQNREKFV